MVPKLQPLDARRHAGHGWKRGGALGFAAQHAQVPVLVAELSALLPAYALAFARRGSGFQLVALLGLHGDENLYLNQHAIWQTGYLPSPYRSYPFGLAEMEHAGEKRAVLCFDQNSGLYREHPDPDQGEERFFTDSGELQPLVRHTLTFLEKCAVNRRATQRAVGDLVKAGLLEPWQWQLSNPDPERPLQTDLHRINQTGLGALDGPTLAHLRDSGALGLAYAQLFSLGRVQVLQRLFTARHSPASAAEDIDVEALFGAAEQDSLRFDWDDH